MSGMAKSGRGFRAWLAAILAPFPQGPANVRAALVELQYRRLHALTPVLTLAIIANTAAMAVAVMGDLPLWQQIIPPAIIAIAAAWRFSVWRQRAEVPPTDVAYKQLSRTVPIVAALGLVAGLWGVNAFVETERFYCIVAPVFVGLSALVGANCLASVPRAAEAAMAGALGPLVVKMLLFPNLGIRSMAVMLIIIGLLQARLIRAKFVETISMLTLQNEIAELADHDSLTGLQNRRAFSTRLDAALASGRGVTVVALDLDGFKGANDAHGHQAGDAILIEVARRMQTVAISASCVARLGGDEFALIFDGVDAGQMAVEIDAVRAMIGLPYDLSDARVSISASIGSASNADGAVASDAILKAADLQLYAEKAIAHARRAA
jgi:diguanylate cyclase (GGDEF)-like protein